MATIKSQIPDTYPGNMPTHWPLQAQGPGGDITTERLTNTTDNKGDYEVADPQGTAVIGSQGSPPGDSIVKSPQPAASSAEQAVAWLVMLTSLLATTAWALAL